MIYPDNKKYSWQQTGYPVERGTVLDALAVLSQRGLAVLDRNDGKIYLYTGSVALPTHFADYCESERVGHQDLYGRWTRHDTADFLAPVHYLFDSQVPTHHARWIAKQMLSAFLARYVAMRAGYASTVGAKATLPTSLPSPDQVLTLTPAPAHVRPARLPFE